MIDKNRRVSVYFNSPVEHHTEVCLRDVRYLVQPAGRAKVLKERRKNVHAFLTGYLVDRVPVPAMSFDVIYNPYKYSTFVSADDRDPQEWSEYAYLSCGEGWKYVEAIFTDEYFNSDLLKVSA
jgi:hypothetical protein